MSEKLRFDAVANVVERLKSTSRTLSQRTISPRSDRPYESIAPSSLCSPLAASERGIVISSPIYVDGSNVSGSSALDPQELRRSLLFYDKIAWPDNMAMSFGTSAETAFLMDEGKLFRPMGQSVGDVGTVLRTTFFESHTKLDQRDPGQWSMSIGEQSIHFPAEMVAENYGLLTTLYGAIPIPEKDVPLEDILRFREQRLSEFLQLRAEIDGFYQSWVRSEDRDHSYAMSKGRIEVACNAAIRVANESSLPFKLSSWKVGFSASGSEILQAVGAMAASRYLELPDLVGLASAAASFISVKRDIGLRSPTKDMAPFSIVSTIHRDLG